MIEKGTWLRSRHTDGTLRVHNTDGERVEVRPWNAYEIRHDVKVYETYEDLNKDYYLEMPGDPWSQEQLDELVSRLVDDPIDKDQVLECVREIADRPGWDRMVDDLWRWEGMGNYLRNAVEGQEMRQARSHEWHRVAIIKMFADLRAENAQLKSELAALRAVTQTETTRPA